MTIMPRTSAVDAGGLIIKVGGALAVPIILYGLFAVPLGMSMSRYACSMVPFIMAATGVVGTGMFLLEHGRIAGIPFGDGPEDDLADCIPAMISQTFAIAVAVGGFALGMAVACGGTAV